MKKNLLAGLLFLLVLISCFSLEWPGQEQKFTKLFGQRNKASKTFSKGIIFKNVKTVKASEHGKHLITIGQKNSSFPSTLGNTVIFIHEDGLQTIYANLKDTNLFSSRTKTETSSVVGQTGHSAWAEKESLIFQVVDTKKEVFINPLLLLPAINDQIKPKVENVFLTDKNNKQINLTKVKTIKQGAYNLYANVYDLVEIETGNKLSPFRVSVLINGINVITVPFEVLETKEKSCNFENTNIDAQRLYQKKDTMNFGNLNLTSGKVDLTIKARDITGNEVNKTFSFNVK